MDNLKDAILGKEDTPTETVHISQWGMDVRVRGMIGDERDQFEISLMVDKPLNRAERRKGGSSKELNLSNVRAKLCVRCIVDDAGNRVFGDEDAAALGKKSAAALDTIYEVAQRLSGISDDDVDELAEAMVERPFDDSSSHSPES